MSNVWDAKKEHWKEEHIFSIIWAIPRTQMGLLLLLLGISAPGPSKIEVMKRLYRYTFDKRGGISCLKTRCEVRSFSFFCQALWCSRCSRGLIFPWNMMPNLFSVQKNSGTVTGDISKDTFGKMSFSENRRWDPLIFFLNVQVYAYARQTWLPKAVAY